MSDFHPVERPAHYNSHPSGIEVIDITEHENFCLGNAIKYILRVDLKGNPVQDLEKARWYIDREIRRRKFLQASAEHEAEAQELLRTAEAAKETELTTRLRDAAARTPDWGIS